MRKNLGFAKYLVLALLLFTAVVVSGCSPKHSETTTTPSSVQPATPTAQPASAGKPGGRMDWNQVCLNATIRAIQMEISKYNTWLQTANGSNKQMYQKALEYLQDELKKYQSMKPEDYKVGSAFHYIPGVTIGSYGRGDLSKPNPIELKEAWSRGSLPGIIDYKGMSRSGPFYIVVGVKGGDFSAIKPGVHYRMKLVPIMPESYPFTSYYVCVESFEEVK